MAHPSSIPHCSRPESDPPYHILKYISMKFIRDNMIFSSVRPILLREEGIYLPTAFLVRAPPFIYSAFFLSTRLFTEPSYAYIGGWVGRGPVAMVTANVAMATIAARVTSLLGLANPSDVLLKGIRLSNQVVSAKWTRLLNPSKR